MKSHKALIIRQGHAVGDAIFITAMPRLLAEQGYEVDLAIMEHNQMVFENNPHVHHIHVIPKELKTADEWRDWINAKGIEYDKVLAVAGHVEMTYLHKTDSSFGAIPSMQQRREKAKGVNYIDYIYQSMGFPLAGVIPEFYFSDDEENKRQILLKNKRDRRERLVCWQWEGSSKSKMLSYSPVYLQAILKAIPRSQHFIFTTLQEQADQIPEDPRCHLISNIGWSIRESIIMASIADLVIGPESLWVNAAGAFDTPKLCFFSHSSPENLVKYYKNAYAVVPKCDCSPCYLICSDFRDIWHPPERRAVARAYEKECQTWDKKFPYRSYGYKCCVELPHDAIIAQIIQILKHGGFEKVKDKGKKGKGKPCYKGNGEATSDLLHV